MSSSEYRIFVVECPSFDPPKEYTEISIANLKTEEKGRYYQNSKHKICIRKERRHQNPGSAALLTSLLRAGSRLLSEPAANKSFPGVKTSQIPTEGKYGTSCNPVLSTLNERGNRRGGGGGWLRHHEGK